MWPNANVHKLSIAILVGTRPTTHIGDK